MRFNDNLHVAVVLALLTLCCARPSGRAAETQPRVDSDEERGTITIEIPSRDGAITTRDIVRGIAQACKLDADALADDTDSHSWDLRNRSVRMLVSGISAAVPGLRMRITRATDNDAPVLTILLDRRDVEEKVRQLKRILRERTAGDDRKYGLVLDEGWQRLATRRPLVVIVHGYNSRPESFRVLRTELTERGFPCAAFAYPNDAPPAESGALLAAELREFREQHPAQAVSLVAHSMGGLVARVALEDPAIDPGNVQCLIMVCTPNLGTKWAEIPGGFDCFEHGPWKPEETIKTAFLGTISDGLNEARSDLKPNSAFLKELNRRPRNPQVRYAQILGTAGLFDAAQFVRFRDRVERSLGDNRAGNLVRPRVLAFLDDLDEIQTGRGDGVVALKRGRLPGVEDTVLLPITHTAVTDAPRISPELRDAIIGRL